MDTVIQILKGTPIWVYIFFVYLLFVGFLATKTGVVHIAKLALLPVIFLFLSIETLVTHFAINGLSVSTWLIALAVGSLIGYLLVCRHNLRVDRKYLLLEMPGSWLTMILILIIFFGKYYAGYQMSVDPGAVMNTHTEMVVLAVSAFCTGLFVGRMLHYVKCIISNPSVDLKQKK